MRFLFSLLFVFQSCLLLAGNDEPFTQKGYINVGFRWNKYQTERSIYYPAFNNSLSRQDTIGADFSGKNTCFYFNMERMERFLYWEMDMAVSGKGEGELENYNYFDAQSSHFSEQNHQLNFRSARFDVGLYLGGLIKGKFGVFLGGHYGYNNTFVSGYPTSDYKISQYGGVNRGLGGMLIFPFIKGQFRFTLLFNKIDNNELKLNATGNTAGFVWNIHFDKRRSGGLTIGYYTNNLRFKDYPFKAYDGSDSHEFKHGYFQLGILFPFFHWLNE
ncbi:MAG TPA: hypothetical protein PK637_03415 [Flavobacteriales bacterium]|nr:hypothetical protein [Flavobacteriales bacterium]HRE95786.1 hypothetical protein [Flavobacteriales bacterium]HRJ35535.1 hypothetical protein [Flavobacteriales bacterium]HRJ38705.1 hypothetical protein [Flavobacteriales bacterium]